MTKKYWEEWGADGGWTVPIVIADCPPIRISVSGESCIFDDEKAHFYVRTMAYVVEPEHPMCPEMTGDQGWLGCGSSILEGVYERNFYDERDTIKRDILRRARATIRDLIDDSPEWFVDWLREEVTQ